jgi:hypothetical protein
MASMKDPKTPYPKVWIGSVRRAAGDNGNFVIIPECKGMEPVSEVYVSDMIYQSLWSNLLSLVRKNGRVCMMGDGMVEY